MYSIGGIASGLDTSSIIKQLMQIERQPIFRYEDRQAQLRRVDDAWADVSTDLSAFRDALDDVRHSADWNSFVSATSSNEDAVTVSVTGTPDASSSTFTVDQLATHHRMSTDTGMSSPDDTVGSGQFSVTDTDGTNRVTISTDASTTLDDLATQINDADVGVTAQVLKVADGDHRLVLDATETGAVNQFDISTDLASLGTPTNVQNGQDAQLSYGSGLTVTRSSNTIDDLIDGATVELHQTTTSDVTVTTEQDTAGAGDAVATLVETANTVLSTLDTHTDYDAESGRSGALQGESAARDLQTQIRSLFSSAVGDGTYNHGSQIGISLTRDGSLELDRTKLDDALATDYDAVADFLGQSFSGPADVTLGGATDSTLPGDYDLDITTAAEVATVTGSGYTPPASDKTFTLTTDDGTAHDITLTTAATDATAAKAQIDQQLADAGVTTIEVDDAGGVLTFSESRYGAGVEFTVANLGDGMDGTHAGVDVDGILTDADGNTMATVGTGQSLRVTDGDADGMTIRYDGTTTGAIGTITYGTGLGGGLSEYLDGVEGVDGSLQRARDAIDGRIRSYDDQIEAFEQRLELREQTLRRQFTSMETSLSQLQQQGQWLAGQLASLGGAAPTG